MSIDQWLGMKQDRKESILIGTLIGGVLVLLIGLWIFASYQEAQTFRKITGRDDVTTWDAMFSQLRIDGR
jgi:xanthine/uracil permease